MITDKNELFDSACGNNKFSLDTIAILSGCEQCTICTDNWSKQHRAIDWNNKFQFRAERRRNLIHWSVGQCYCLYQDCLLSVLSINPNFVSGSL